MTEMPTSITPADLGDDPALPYAGTSGHSGGATSEERARREDSDGTTGVRQLTTLRYLARATSQGATWKELSGALAWHHGQASGALSNLHKVGRIARLTERRDRCFVYVLPEYVGGRETQEPQTRGSRNLTAQESLEVTGVRNVLAADYPTVAKWRVEQLLAIIERLTS